MVKGQIDAGLTGVFADGVMSDANGLVVGGNGFQERHFTEMIPEELTVHFIADDQGAFVGALGMLFDASALLGAPRSKVRPTIDPSPMALYSCWVTLLPAVRRSHRGRHDHLPRGGAQPR